jgi:hypothetical protein
VWPNAVKLAHCGYIHQGCRLFFKLKCEECIVDGTMKEGVKVKIAQQLVWS